MFARRLVLLAGILAGTPPLHASEPLAAADDESRSKQFAAAIDTFNALDPQSPDTLTARLSYANFLTKLDRGDCRAHLDEAQSQLDVAAANRALAIVLPSGLARIADLEYQLHSARASCGAGAAIRESELRAALEAAQRAVDLYRDAFDAVSMVTMQFNVSVAYHELGDIAAASAALKRTLDSDREYGFEDDAEDNYRLLLQWTDQDASPEQIEARTEAQMKDFPERSATLSFGWQAGDATLTLQSDVSQLAGADFAHFHASLGAKRRVRQGLDSWVVTHQPADPSFDFGELPGSEELQQAFANSLAHVLMHFHDFRLSRKGDFGRGKGDFSFGARARAEAKTLSRQLGTLDSGASGGRAAQLARLVSVAVRGETPETMDAQSAESYNFEAGTWIGATLEQGVWYNMTAVLRLPLAPHAFLTHQIQFTYSRPVPCVTGSAADSCIEIVLRAAPEATILKSGLDALAFEAHLPHGQVPRLWSATTMRLVTDPKTLWTYSLETRWHTYWSNGEKSGPDRKIEPDQPLIEAVKTVLSLSAPTP